MRSYGRRAPPARTAATGSQRRLDAHLHAADPARLPASQADLLDPDNLSCHWTPAIREWAEQNNVELVPTPTYASYLNRIESHFGAISEFVVKNADYLDWDSFTLAIANHISYRNHPDRRRRRLEQRQRRLAWPPEP